MTFAMTKEASAKVLKRLEKKLKRKPTAMEIEAAEQQYLQDFEKEIQKELRKAGLK